MSRSAYYSWRKTGQGPSRATLDEAWLANRIYDVWASSRGRYGAPRVTAALLRAGVEVNEKRVARLMAALGIAGKSGRKKLRTTERDPSATLAADLVERDFAATAPDELYVGDITYIPTDEGWVFVASVLDVCTRMLVGWSIADHLRAELCVDALESAARARGRGSLEGAVFHSDGALPIRVQIAWPPTADGRSLDQRLEVRILGGRGHRQPGPAVRPLRRVPGQRCGARTVAYSDGSPFVGSPSAGLSYAKVGALGRRSPTRDLWCS